jgi:hypothetical protein
VFVENRMFFLDRFMKDIGSLPYLYESQELQVFLRPTGPVEGALKVLNNMITDELI